MTGIKFLIKKYWLDTPERFFEQYKTPTLKLIYPVNLFLHARREKALELIGDAHGKRILDVGCGSGVFIIELIKRGAYAVGVDYSNKMLDEAKRQLGFFKVPKSKYTLKKADATKLPFKNGEFDVILATGLTDYLSNEQNELFIKEAKRVLVKNGKLIISFPVAESPFSFLRSGLGLKIRQKLFNLPPIENSFTKDRIKSHLATVNLKAESFDKIFSTMWLVVASHS